METTPQQYDEKTGFSTDHLCILVKNNQLYMQRQPVLFLGWKLMAIFSF